MLGAHEAARASKAMKHQQRVVVGPMVFTSDFDSGNMGLVALKQNDESESCEVSRGAGDVLEYVIDVAPDGGTVHETGFKSWFFFGLSVAEPIELVSEQSEPGRGSYRISFMSMGKCPDNIPNPTGCDSSGKPQQEKKMKPTQICQRRRSQKRCPCISLCAT